MKYSAEKASRAAAGSRVAHSFTAKPPSLEELPQPLAMLIAASAVAVPQADCRKRRRDQPSAAARSSAMSRTRSSITFCFGVCGIG